MATLLSLNRECYEKLKPVIDAYTKSTKDDAHCVAAAVRDDRLAEMAECPGSWGKKSVKERND